MSTLDVTVVRELAPSDDLEELTALIHRAYAALGAMGLRYVAVDQPPETTARRAARGACAVATIDGVIVGTITFLPPDRAGGAPWYDRPDVAAFAQFAVDPPAQRAGIGSMLLEHAEARAVALGARELACDTAEGAPHLIGFYERRGYRFVEHVDWRPVTNYRSVILSKALPDGT